MSKQTISGFSRRGLFAAGAKLGGLMAFAPGLLHAAEPVQPSARGDREQWLAWLEAVSEPVLKAASEHSLRRLMPVEAVLGHEKERAIGSPLEALGRLLCGLAPWLESEPSAGESPGETSLRARYRAYAQQAIASAVDPASSDYMRFGESAQTLVDSSFLSLAILRAPRQLFASMDAATKKRLVTALQSERKVQPPFNNWLLFAALNEVMLRTLDADWDRLRIDYALREHESWYVGDGVYGDGPQFHADFYNSYVIQPYLLAVLEGVHEERTWQGMEPAIKARARRYAAIQERSIAPDGTYPLTGRSLTYRAGAFHLLADASLRGLLPEHLSAGATRSALTAVQQRTLGAPGTFSPEGWLQIGIAGHQPSLAETYISTGSLYLCSAAWLPLGLSPAHPFWSEPKADWSQKRLWSGGSGILDHALDDRSGKAPV